MFLRVLAAMVAADAFDRRMREQQRQRWQAQMHRQQVGQRYTNRTGMGFGRAGSGERAAEERPSERLS